MFMFTRKCTNITLQRICSIAALYNRVIVLLECFAEDLICGLVRVDQFATIKSQNLTIVNTHDPCQNAIVRSQRVNFSADLAHLQRFVICKIF